MNHFDILNRSTPISHSYLLEASAGTGKTYFIENLVARLILKIDDALPIEKILVVTFTRAATRDLKQRIRATLQKVLFDLKSMNFQSADYVCAILEQGNEAVKKSIRRLEDALFSFDQAQIFTIHAFCARMLRECGFEGGVLFDAVEGQLTDSQILRIIRDFFRTSMHSKAYSPEQLRIVLKEFNDQMDLLEKALLRQITRGLKIADIQDFSTALQSFNQIMRDLVENAQLSRQKINEDFERQMGCYNKIGDKTKALLKVDDFAALFDKSHWDAADLNLLLKEGIYLLEALNPDNLRKNKTTPPKNQLHFPDLEKHLSHQLKPFIDKIANPYTILAQMAGDCRKMMRRYMQEEELIRFDELLISMEEALKQDLFLNKIREKYRAAIIDEFQDTDPIQWKIFDLLFLKKEPTECHLYLVGDPKQSIYAFRQADIYTYLSAAHSLGKQNHASLNCNYRSTPQLVNALNVLFTSAPHFMPIPRHGECLNYPEVKASERIQSKIFNDSLGALHFFLMRDREESGEYLSYEELEEKYLFPFVAQEIIHLNDQGIPFNSFAILVKDQWQSHRLAGCLKKRNLPFSNQKQSSLAESFALPALKELLRVMLHPKDESGLKSALGGPLCGWTHEDICTLSDPLTMETALKWVYDLRRIFLDKGFGEFFNIFLHHRFEKDAYSISEKMLNRKEGEQLYYECLQIAELLIEYQASTSAGIEGILLYLDEFKKLEFDGDEKIKKRTDASQNSIHILTLHMSKGLEYDIVFPIGLCKRSPTPDSLIPIYENQQFVITPVHDRESSAFQMHCEEADAEKMRQLYVGLTRAKQRLYVPAIFLSKQKKKIEPGTASPMELFIARINSIGSGDSLYAKLQQPQDDEFTSALECMRARANISYEWLNGTEFPPASHLDSSPCSLVASKPCTMQIPPIYIQSYTGLSRFLSVDKEEGWVQMDLPPSNFDEIKKDRHTLPASAKTGILLHAILEKIPLQEAFSVQTSSDLAQWIRPFLANGPYENWEDVFCDIIYDVLRMPLGDFLFSDLNEQTCLRELEFLYPSRDLDNLNLENGFLKGVIDLLFEHKGKYYLIDWKSNWLGPSNEYYQNENLTLAIREKKYDLQAKIYCNAIKKYLQVFENIDVESQFGGIFYIFLRGIDPLANPQNGVFFYPWI